MPIASRVVIAVLLAVLLLSCGKPPQENVVGPWQNKETGDTVILHRDQTANGTFRIVFAEYFRTLPPGKTYVNNIEGKPINKWSLDGDNKPCAVSATVRGTPITFDVRTVSLTPDYSEITQVPTGGVNTLFLSISGCRYYENIPTDMRAPTEGDASTTYRDRLVGTLTVRAKYRLPSADRLEIFVTSEAVKEETEVVIATFQVIAHRLVLADGGILHLATGAFDKTPVKPSAP